MDDITPKEIKVKKSLIIMAMFLTVSSLTASEVQQKDRSSNLCELFTEKAKFYKLHMNRDLYAEAALASFEKKVKNYCLQEK